MDGVWTRTHITRGQVEHIWGNYSSTQKIYNSIDNCWDLCYEFDEGMPGERDEYDSNDSNNDTYHPPQSNLPISDDPMPHSIPMPAQVSSDCPPWMLTQHHMQILLPCLLIQVTQHHFLF